MKIISLWITLIILNGILAKKTDGVLHLEDVQCRQLIVVLILRKWGFVYVLVHGDTGRFTGMSSTEIFLCLDK